jgi:molybdopterin synthase catalytic subunit
LFLGSVRRGTEDGPVGWIDYSAYEEMAEAEFDRIAREARERWPGARVAARHRLGVVPVGEPSVAVAAAAAHRAEAFEVCRWVIDEVKRRLPIWKRERLDDGTEQWRDNAGVRRAGGQRPAGA